MIHFYHGLFGSPRDWQGIVAENHQNQIHDLYNESLQEMLDLKTDREDILVGYSMGGRVSLEICQRNNFNIKHVILLSTHPGLLESERETRKIWEDDILFKMKNMSSDDFLNFWDSLDIFQSSKLDRSQARPDLPLSARLFDEFRTSTMRVQTDLLHLNSEKITWIVGDRDKKYQKLMHERVIPLGIQVINIQADHRVLQNKESIREILKSKGIT